MDDQSPKPRYWFPAKRYGWGWGFPSTWEGWLVLIGFVVAIGLNAALFIYSLQIPGFVIRNVLLIILLIMICLKTGEPPRWRWGSRDDTKSP